MLYLRFLRRVPTFARTYAHASNLNVAPPKPAHGLTPPKLTDDDVHAERCLRQLRSKDKAIEKYIYLSQLKLTDENMFYKLCLRYMAEFTPLIYTPTVGDACIQFSHNFRRPEGLFVSIHDKGRIGSVIRNWPRIPEARIAVVTDGSRILGLGDLGVNGMPISIGKLSLYVAGAGIRPSSTLPICLDLGTNNETFLADPLYLGHRHPRVPSPDMSAFMHEFMDEMSKAFPKMLIQFEDFSTENAFMYLDAFRERYPVFNDDIQGTGAVVLAGFLNAAKLSSAASGRPLTDHRILFLGAGSAGVGVAMQLMSFFTLQGLSEEEARSRIYLVDSQGLIYDGRGPMAEHKKYFSRTDYAGPPVKDLLDIVDLVKPTALLGLSTTKGAFSQPVLELMAALNPRPIVFPLSNPVRLSECEFHEALTYTRGAVVFASGSPFDPEAYGGRTHYPGQGNNMYVFPGIGLGAILAQAKSVTDSMVEASALGLADALTPDERADDLIYPRLERIREISAHIACAVIRAAQKAGVDRNEALRKLSDGELNEYVTGKMWNPL
ncbi:malate dehydrogenase [Punctularia strigosozonata HHB-11173 SS5]|uniref:malate dehydrogenase n=1 Tax=Punctularia strigosozonata (strain HHB-11173) TaxID=741275 RepID=UPI0004418688|nr:malate dehydrogenase [Punctularia strigosozonata HHB-11173 SS5]EIN08307.1 malate dehydrogenase [Punctularia strigosozonata HHB-11173 SS5]